MYTEHKATIEHFQLRNLMSVPAYNTVHFSSMSKVYSWVPGYDDLQCLIDLSAPSAQSGFHHAVKISTMKSAFGVTIAGGFKGEYAMRAHDADGSGAEGIVTKDDSGITNHVDIISSRTNRSPIGVFASNDNHVRILDCETNTFLADYELTHAINCTSTSPDGRLRVIIGDSPDAWVVEADTGRPVHPLRGHRDFGFACAWSPDMMQIATSNQDKTAMIWDARMWRMLDKFESDVAGYRSLRYSPVGGGPRTLLLCEPADRIVLVNAQTYQTRQVLDFFGEVGGADYSPDGSTIWVANTDEDFGGFMEYDRRQWGQVQGMPPSPNEWVREAELKEDERCTLNDRERHMRFMWTVCDEEHEELLLF
jgi:WD40 repeat protein